MHSKVSDARAELINVLRKVDFAHSVMMDIGATEENVRSFNESLDELIVSISNYRIACVLNERMEKQNG